ncbi:fimbrial protein [Proteus sp. fly-1013]|uniref:fimbrial protein n=1 Tax=Proteus sp. fly-1013 TaxID=3136673 RepID=UPI0032DA4A7B
MKLAQLTIISFFLLFSAQTISYDTLFDIKGKVQASTCILESSKIKDVNLGHISLSENGFGGQIHSTSEKIDWNITLDCPEGLPVILTPKGTVFSGNSTVLALNTSSDTAKGVGVETQYSVNGSNWTTLELNKRNTVVSAAKNEGEVTLNFRGYYKQMEKDVFPGTANATLDLEIVYQ